MVCLKCNSYTHKTKLDGVPISECPKCQGIWCAADDLPKLSSKYGEIDLQSAEVVSSRTDLACKHCGGRIEEIQIATDTESVLLDRCKDCGGVWFDHPELEKTQKLCSDLKKRFGEKKIQRLQKSNRWKERLTAVYKTESPVSKETSLTRNHFISKVYKLFLASLLTGALGAGIGIFIGHDYSNFWLLFVVELLILIGALIVRRTPGWNLAALFAFTAFSGFTTSPLLNVVIKAGASHLILFALGITILIFGSLSYYVHRTKKDFSFMGGFLTTTLFIFLGVLIFGLIFPAYWNTLLFSGFGILLFCGFILYDTSRIILKYDTEEYVAATLDLYLDFLNIFIDVLRILMETSDFDFLP
jgi:FtsH-binding integral membrane protein/Zn-finger nucleic acid-binding protein